MTDHQDNVYILGKGTVLNGHFQVEEVLGAGGFGITYRALDKHLDRVVAIKEFYPGAWVSRNYTSSATVIPISTQHGLLFTLMKEKFIEEAKAMAKLDSSTHVVKVHSYFEENGTAYIVMEYLDGVTLRRHIETHGKMDPDELCRLMIPLIRALNVVHSYKLIHRDIAPDNIMLMPDRTLKLLDFGAARSFSEDTNKSMSVILKHGFAPFEQHQRRGKQGAWTDIYALSATMYYCVTGMIPESAVDRIANDSLRRPSELGIAIRPAIEEALMKGMATLAEDRYQTAMDMAAAFDAAMHSIRNRRIGGPGQTVVDEEPEKDKAEERRDADELKKKETEEKKDADKPTKEKIEENSKDDGVNKVKDDLSFFYRLISKPHRAKLFAVLAVIMILGAAGYTILINKAQIKPQETTGASSIPGETASMGAPATSILASELPTSPPESPSSIMPAPTAPPVPAPTAQPVPTQTALPVPVPTALPEPTPTAQPVPASEMPAGVEIIGRWAEVTTQYGVNVRAKSTIIAPIIGHMEMGERFWVYSQQTVGADVWYSILTNGKDGAVMAQFIRLYSEDESVQYQAALTTPMLYSTTPTPVPTPAWPPTPTPASEVPADGEIIDRWAEVTTRYGVNVRSKGSIIAPIIGHMEMGERFWVYSQQTVGTDVWYSILANGKAGLVMANFTRLYSEHESLQYQANLTTPMPYSTTPTPAPASSPTPEPTPTPVTAQTVPVYYRGTDGTLLYTDQVTLLVGNSVYHANDAFIPAGYKLAGDRAVSITVDANGIVLPRVIEFIYDKPIIVGATVYFGHYEQDNDITNGKEEIAWRVLKVDGDRVLLISEKNLDVQPYEKSYNPVTWETCTLRKWLNSNFINSAFSRDEQKSIITSSVKNDDNPEYGTDGGQDTKDMVFLLSIEEAEKFFGGNADRVSENTAYAKAQRVYTNDSGAGWWWLRSPGINGNIAAIVDSDGSVDRDGSDVSYDRIAVRPALWLDLTSDIVTSEAP